MTGDRCVNRFFLLVLTTIIAACAEDAPPADADPSEFQKQLQTQLITARSGDVITIPAGVHLINRGLSLNVSGVTIRGEGMDKSILSFRNQVQGAEGLLVSASDFTIEDLAIEDTAGDALKVNEGRNIIIRRVRTEWTNGPDEKNGAYGIYPVQTENVLLEESVAIGASDAGIYVGQSRNVVVRNNRAERNVAGIEIETLPLRIRVASSSSICPTCRSQATAPGSTRTPLSVTTRIISAPRVRPLRAFLQAPGSSSTRTIAWRFSITRSPTTIPPISSSAVTTPRAGKASVT
jgi:parallel beta-helix repeat protein